MGVVTISATCGVDAGEIVPAVADALGLPFVDRVIPATVARKPGVSPADPGKVSVADAEERDETVDTRMWRDVRNLYRIAPCGCRLYPLVVDFTALSWDTVTELVVTAARARGIGGRG
jgi:cytidylate kinase